MGCRKGNNWIGFAICSEKTNEATKDAAWLHICAWWQTASGVSEEMIRRQRYNSSAVTFSLSAVHAAIMAGVGGVGGVCAGGGGVLEWVPVETGGDVANVLHCQLVTNNDTLCVRH